METREDLLKLCKYYKGEEDWPEEKDFILWMAEAHFVDYPNLLETEDLDFYKKLGLYGKVNTGLDLRIETSIWIYCYRVACRGCDYGTRDEHVATANKLFLDSIKKY